MLEQRQTAATNKMDTPERWCSPPSHLPSRQTGDLKAVARPRSPLGSAPPEQEIIEAQQPATRELHRTQHGMGSPCQSTRSVVAYGCRLLCVSSLPKLHLSADACTYQLGSHRCSQQQQLHHATSNKQHSQEAHHEFTRSIAFTTPSNTGQAGPTFLSHASPTAYTPSTFVFW